MIVLCHMISVILTELSRAVWNNDVRKIIFEVVQAMDELKDTHKTVLWSFNYVPEGSLLCH